MQIGEIKADSCVPAAFQLHSIKKIDLRSSINFAIFSITAELGEVALFGCPVKYLPCVSGAQINKTGKEGSVNRWKDCG